MALQDSIDDRVKKVQEQHDKLCEYFLQVMSKPIAYPTTGRTISHPIESVYLGWAFIEIKPLVTKVSVKIDVPSIGYKREAIHDASDPTKHKYALIELLRDLKVLFATPFFGDNELYMNLYNSLVATGTRVREIVLEMMNYADDRTSSKEYWEGMSMATVNNIYDSNLYSLFRKNASDFVADLYKEMADAVKSITAEFLGALTANFVNPEYEITRTFRTDNLSDYTSTLAAHPLLENECAWLRDNSFAMKVYIVPAWWVTQGVFPT